MQPSAADVSGKCSNVNQPLHRVLDRPTLKKVAKMAEMKGTVVWVGPSLQQTNMCVPRRRE